MTSFIMWISRCSIILNLIFTVINIYMIIIQDALYDNNTGCTVLQIHTIASSVFI